MRKNIFCFFLTLGGLLGGFISETNAQGFLNLGFESNPVYAGVDQPTGGADYSVPNWTISLNGTAQSGVLSNNYVLDSTTAAILIGSAAGAIEGNNSVFLAASSYEAPVGGVSTAAISQTRIVPNTANSLQFKLGSIDAFGAGIDPNAPQNNFFLTLNGQAVPLQILANAGTYLIMGGNVSQWAGQSAQLSLGVSVPYISFDQGERLFSGTIDSLLFSTAAVPEPSSLGLLTLSAVSVLVLHRGRKRAIIFRGRG